jgi:hypothetical protein
MIEMRSQLLAARAAALFASDLPTGSRPAPTAVAAVIAASVHACGGTRGCVAMMAAAYGDYPETAAPRMRWALSVASMAPAVSMAPVASMAPGATQPEPDRMLVAA